MRFVLLTLALFALTACASPASRIDATAQRAGLVREIVRGTDFRHVVYTRAMSSSDARLTIYLESDGLPWVNGRVPSSDPTSRDPLALKLMLQSKGPALYVTRPCYHELMDEGCSWQQWTLARYSESIVDSMVAAIRTKLHDVNAARVQLVGYSGGGALAVLIAERLADVERVVTIAANLDTDAWTTHHGYLPLQGSLNPARGDRPHPWEEVHLQGGKDTVVPIATTEAYFKRHPASRRITFENFDHACCWTEELARKLLD